MSSGSRDDFDVSQLLAHFQEITGIEDQSRSLEILEAHNWNLETAVQDTLNVIDGRSRVFQDTPGGTYSGQASSLFQDTPGGTYSGQASSLIHSKALVTSQQSVVFRTWEWIINLAFFPVRFIITTASDLLQFLFHLVFGSQPRVAQNPLADVNRFIDEFEAIYGPRHPPFKSCTYSQALDQARQELKFLLVYLHSPGHEDTADFCTRVMGSQQLIDFVSANCLLWAVGVNTEEGVRVSYVLRENTYPFLALIVLKQSRMVVVERIEGLLPANEVVARLQRAIATNEAELVVERSERERRSFDQRIREEQDRAYQDSLLADKEKEKKRLDEQKKAEEMKTMEMEQKKKEKETQERRVHCASLVPSEPSPTEANIIHVVIRLPSGGRLERRFKASDKLEAVYNFVHTSPDLPNVFTLMSNFPRKELACEADGGPVLAELELGTKCALYIKDDSS